MRITFHLRDHSGFYDGQIGFGAPACGNGHVLIGFGEINFEYQPFLADLYASRHAVLP